ncbi:MAG: hypothetical protein ACRD2A_09360, partial [Vicinamibacterales bacterium]
LNTAIDGRYRIEKEVLTDPWRDVVLQRIRFVPLQGTLADFRLYVMLAPHLANRGSGNTAWVADYKGAPMLFAERDHHALALASTAPWLSRSVGFVGVSDGWQDLQAHKRLSQTFRRHTRGVCQVLEGLAREARERHTTKVAKPALSHQCRGLTRARIQTRGRRDHRQLVDPMGLLQA